MEIKTSILKAILISLVIITFYDPTLAAIDENFQPLIPKKTSKTTDENFQPLIPKKPSNHKKFGKY